MGGPSKVRWRVSQLPVLHIPAVRAASPSPGDAAGRCDRSAVSRPAASAMTGFTVAGSEGPSLSPVERKGGNP
jgi:hypothetical protein